MKEVYAAVAAAAYDAPLGIAGDDGRVLWANAAFDQYFGGGGTDPGNRTVVDVLMAASIDVPPDLASTLEGGVGALPLPHVVPFTDTAGTERTLRFASVKKADQSASRMVLLSVAPADVPPQQVEPIGYSERKLLLQTCGWLYAANAPEELLKIIGRSMRQLLPGSVGQLYIYTDDRDTLDLASHWGPAFLTDSIGRDDCWALRRGRAYGFGMNAIDFPCPHNDDHTQASFCVPIVAHGDAIGLLHISFPEIEVKQTNDPKIQQMLENRWDLALICAEQISLSIANVRLREELQNRSVRDQLTGLHNRRWFLETCQREINRAVARNDALSVLMLDIDHFKKINDTFGHDCGDLVLKRVAAELNGAIEAPLVPCRLGGEEFGVLAPGMSAEAAERLAENVLSVVENSEIRYNGALLPQVTVSCGVAAAPSGGENTEELMKAADLALYAAKAAGRNRVVLDGDLPLTEHQPIPEAS